MERRALCLPLAGLFVRAAPIGFSMTWMTRRCGFWTSELSHTGGQRSMTVHARCRGMKRTAALPVGGGYCALRQA